jgi:cytochrome c
MWGIALHALPAFAGQTLFLWNPSFRLQLEKLRPRYRPAGDANPEEWTMIGSARWMVAALVLALAACGGEDREAPDRNAAVEDGLTAFQLEHGIGPFTESVELGPLDPELAAEGEEIFQFNCEACHRMQDRFVGPALGDVLERRTPAFVLNMIMNPEQMAREHPEVRELLREYPVIMPYQNVSEDQARAIVEYLRTETP